MAGSRPTLRESAAAWGADPAVAGLDRVVEALAEGALQVQSKIQSAALGDALGATGEVNVHGETVQILDQQSSDVFVEALDASGVVAAVGSEEIAEGVIFEDDPERRFIVLMDPLDGSSNIDVAVSIGSIFGVWLRQPGETLSERSLLRRGSEQVAAVYVVYGSSAILVAAIPGRVDGFTLNTATGEFELTHADMRFPAKRQYYSVPDGYYQLWDEPTRRAATMLRDTYSLRYVGSLVADFHRNLIKGGVFWYPADAKSKEGKLRLMYEANPLAFVAEQAGGAASNGRQRIMDVTPSALHQRTPLMLGPADVVEETTSLLSE